MRRERVRAGARERGCEVKHSSTGIDPAARAARISELIRRLLERPRTEARNRRIFTLQNARTAETLAAHGLEVHDMSTCAEEGRRVSVTAARANRRLRRRRNLDPSFYIDAEIKRARDEGKSREEFLERIAKFPGTPGVMLLLVAAARKRWDETLED